MRERLKGIIIIIIMINEYRIKQRGHEMKWNTNNINI